jgi:WD40 repeat protein
MSAAPPVCPLCDRPVLRGFDAQNTAQNDPNAIVDAHIGRGCPPEDSEEQTTGNTVNIPSGGEGEEDTAERDLAIPHVGVPYVSNATRRACFAFCFQQDGLKEEQNLLSVLPKDLIRQIALEIPLSVVDPAHVRRLHSLKYHDSYVWSLAANSSLIVSGGGDNTVKIFSWTGELLHSCAGHTNSVRSIAITDPTLFSTLSSTSNSMWSSDPVAIEQLGSERLSSGECPVRVVSGSDDHFARVWDPVTGVCVANWRCSNGPVLAVAAADLWCVTNADNFCLTTWSYDGTPLRTFPAGHTAEVYSCCLLSVERGAPEGLRVVSGSFDKTARVWDPRTGECLLVLKVGLIYPFGVPSPLRSRVSRVCDFCGDVFRVLIV